MKLMAWIFFVLLCVSVSFYPLLYLLANDKIALLESKSDTLFNHMGWRIGFYSHIVGGGIALLVGWTQFVKPWRTRYLHLHRWLGKLYVAAVTISAVAGISISPFSTTGLIAALGFGSLGVIWLLVTLQALRSIWAHDLRKHEQLMIYSYAACFAAVTLRLWLPILLIGFQLNFNVAYPIVAWLSWVPNLLVAYWLAGKK